MTLVVAWIAVDTHGPSSIYLASDSRVSWGTYDHFDHGRKVFGCTKSPDIFAYCGDVLFPSIVLNQIVDIADSGVLFSPSDSCEVRFQAIFKKLVELFNLYPHFKPTIMDDSFEVIHAARDAKGEFFIRSMKWTRANKRWCCTQIGLGKDSDKLHVTGTGKDEFLLQYDFQWGAANAKTSRALFHAFIDTLSNIKDPYCGGPPQLVGLYRGIGNARFYGITYSDARYLHGVKIGPQGNFTNFEWRNEFFERCDGITMSRNEKAQKQPNARA